MRTEKDFAEFLKLLRKYSVKFCIIGRFCSRMACKEIFKAKLKKGDK